MGKLGLIINSRTNSREKILPSSIPFVLQYLHNSRIDTSGQISLLLIHFSLAVILQLLTQVLLNPHPNRLFLIPPIRANPRAQEQQSLHPSPKIQSLVQQKGNIFPELGRCLHQGPTLSTQDGQLVARMSQGQLCQTVQVVYYLGREGAVRDGDCCHLVDGYVHFLGKVYINMQILETR